MRKTFLCPFSGMWFSLFTVSHILNAIQMPGTPKDFKAHAGLFILGRYLDHIFLPNKKTRTERYPNSFLKYFIFPEWFYLKIFNQKKIIYTVVNYVEIIEAFPELGFGKGFDGDFETCQLTILNTLK